MKPSTPATGEVTVDPREYWKGCFSSDHPGMTADETDPPLLPDPEPVIARRRRLGGWTAEKQGMFLNTLANTGSVAFAAEAAGITPRSAYRLRNHPAGAAFARAWEAALMTAANRLTAVAPLPAE